MAAFRFGISRSTAYAALKYVLYQSVSVWGQVDTRGQLSQITNLDLVIPRLPRPSGPRRRLKAYLNF